MGEVEVVVKGAEAVKGVERVHCRDEILSVESFAELHLHLQARKG